MKKLGFLVIGLCCGLMLFTGCGKKTLNCEINMDSYMSGMGTMKGISNIGFDKDGYASDVEVAMEAKITSGDVTENDMNTIKSYLEQVCASNGSAYDSCNVKVSGKTVTMKATGSIKNIAQDGVQRTKEEAKEYYENVGFTCN